MHVIDLEGNEYPLQATTTNDGDVNGNQSLSTTIQTNKVNNLFIDDIGEMWNVVDHDEVEHKVIYAKKKGNGNRLSVNIKAIPLFFDVLKRDRIYERIDKHMTAHEAFSHVFADTGFDFVLVDSFLAVQWEGFGDGEEKIETFKRALNRYKAEFRISGRTVYLESLIGRDTAIMYRHRLNASNIVQEIDANNFWTFARGYGDYEDEESESSEPGEGGWENAKLIREYTSPLASIPGIGIRHAPPIKDGRITDKEVMDDSLKTLVDDSLKISVSADIHDLRKQGYPVAQSQLGDRVFLIDERIGLNDEVRVISQSVTRDWKGNVIGINITFGSEGIAKRRQSDLDTAIKDIKDIVEGRKVIPYSILPETVKDYSDLLKSALTELEFNNGIIAREKDDPNAFVLFNSRGIGITINGGVTFDTALTARGIVADVITAGTLRGINIIGTNIISFNPDTGDVVTIDNGEIETFVAGEKRFGIYGDGLKAFSWITGEEVARFRSTNLDGMYGAGIMGSGDYFNIGGMDEDGSDDTYLFFDFNNRTIDFYEEANFHDNATVNNRLLFNLDREWEFIGYGSGASSSLGLHALHGLKVFTITDIDHYPVIDVRAGTGGSQGRIEVFGNFAVTGSKNALVQTENYGKRLMYADESTESFFSTRIHKNLAVGNHTIGIDPMFLETVSGYLVLPIIRNGATVIIQDENKSNFVVEVTDKPADVVFIVSGTRKGFEGVYMEEHQDDAAEVAALSSIDSSALVKPTKNVINDKGGGKDEARKERVHRVRKGLSENN